MTRRAIAVVALAAGIGAIVARALADCLGDIDRAFQTYAVETVPDTVPAAWFDH